MGFTFYKPQLGLNEFIEAYWELRSDSTGEFSDSLLPDGCVDLIINAGERFAVPSENVMLEHGKVYIGGVMTHAIHTLVPPECRLIGVRFKPGCLSNFQQHDSLHLFKDGCTEMSKKLMPDLMQLDKGIINGFDTFYAKMLKPTNHRLSLVLQYIYGSHGTADVRSIAAQNFTTERQLERDFRQYVGLSPKQFSNIIRFQYANRMLENRLVKQSLLSLALNLGYCDHAHFSKEFKKYAGFAPSRS